MYTASCLCGACKISFSTIIGTGFCHCTTCRKMTSSLFSTNTIVPTSSFKLTSGSPKQRLHLTGSGAESTMNFCTDCGGLLWMDYSPRPDIKAVKGGTIDGEDLEIMDALRPKVEQFTARRPSWLCAIEGAVQEEGQQALKKADAMIEDLKAGREKA